MRIFFALSALVFSASAFADGQAKLNEFIRSVEFFQADFTQAVYDASGAEPQRSVGKLSIARPGKFRWELKTPYKQVLVSDGREVKVYDADLEQMTVRPAQSALKNTPISLLMGQSDLNADFVVSNLGEQNGFDWVQLKPKRADSDFERVAIAFKGNTPVVMDLKDTLGQSTQVSFRNLKTSKHNTGIYRFSPPSGVDVVYQN
ncbi:MAG: outer membrane lipoprotein chaperone LolA [Gammaproteobacteria bacterium]|nr:outer membrane lipoprotein chaperone LolA [Gammaproteobacteria bacterium]